jgi:nitrate/nitrite transporter NarK
MTSVGYAESFALWSSLSFASAAILSISGLGGGLREIGGSSAAKIDRRTDAALMMLTVGALTGNLGVVAILPLHMVDTFGLEKSFVASVIGLSRTLSVFGQLAGGVLFDRLGFRRTAAILTALNVITILYLTFGSYGVLYVSAMVISTLATAMFFPVMYAYVASTLGSDSGPVLGKMLGVGGLIGATLMPAVAGSLAEAHGYTAALMVPAAIVLSSVIAFVLSEFPSGSRSSF